MIIVKQRKDTEKDLLSQKPEKVMLKTYSTNLYTSHSFIRVAPYLS